MTPLHTHTHTDLEVNIKHITTKFKGTEELSGKEE